MKKTTKILVAGSTNMDMVVNTPTFPAPGETVIGKRFFMNAGGKGANQAVAAARLGGDVLFLAKTGNDIFGKQMMTNLKNEKIKTDFILTDPEQPSGIALITVNDKGENHIVVAPGANANLSPEDAGKIVVELNASGVILMQLETPVETIGHIAEMGWKKDKTVILNPAPARALPADLWKHITILTPNKNEAEFLSGIQITDLDTAEKSARLLMKKGPSVIVITLGSEGALLFDGSITKHIPVPRVKVVDSTAAGDTFNGALAVTLAEGKSLEDAVFFANHAAALSVQKAGAQQSVPTRNEVTNFLKSTH